MDKTEAERLVVETEGRLCVRFYQRFDGTVLTRDCPVGVRAARRRLARTIACATMLLLSLCAYALRHARLTNLPSSVQRIVDTIDPPHRRPQRIGQPAIGKRVAPLPAPRLYLGEIMTRHELQSKSGIVHATTWQPSD